MKFKTAYFQIENLSIIRGRIGHEQALYFLPHDDRFGRKDHGQLHGNAAGQCGGDVFYEKTLPTLIQPSVSFENGRKWTQISDSFENGRIFAQ